jgi:hypothetical protein
MNHGIPLDAEQLTHVRNGTEVGRESVAFPFPASTLDLNGCQRACRASAFADQRIAAICLAFGQHHRGDRMCAPRFFSDRRVNLGNAIGG